jgi:DNA/RNA-binding domain of Phe-tRNA-synthetase-like protein
MISVAPHEKLYAPYFRCSFTAEPQSSARVLDLLAKRVPCPLTCDDNVRSEVRALLRYGGFKASGRSKPASEYLEKAFQDGFLNPINAMVDCCNAVSLHSGLPISVIDLERTQGALKLEIVAEKQSYVFNPSGQELDLKGLICLWDEQGPCASPVKDSQRSKTQSDTRQTLCLIWGSQSLRSQVDAALALYQELLQDCGGHL